MPSYLTNLSPQYYDGTLSDLCAKMRPYSTMMNQWVDISVVPACLLPAFDEYLESSSEFTQCIDEQTGEKQVMTREIGRFWDECYYRAGLPYPIQFWTPLDEELAQLKQDLGL